METKTKKCSKCGVEKPLTEYYGDKRAPDGRAYSCKACDRARSKNWTCDNPARRAEIAAKWEKDNQDARRAQNQKWEKSNPDRRKELSAKWQDANPDVYQASLKKGRKKWNAANPAKVAAKGARHRTRKIQAMPAWANEFFIEEAYALAKLRTELTGIRWEVDHIVPLNSKKVCGLHVGFNLQVIPKKQNQHKSNRHWPDMPVYPRVLRGSSVANELANE